MAHILLAKIDWCLHWAMLVHTIMSFLDAYWGMMARHRLTGWDQHTNCWGILHIESVCMLFLWYMHFHHKMFADPTDITELIVWMKTITNVECHIMQYIKSIIVWRCRSNIFRNCHLLCSIVHNQNLGSVCNKKVIWVCWHSQNHCLHGIQSILHDLTHWGSV